LNNYKQQLAQSPQYFTPTDNGTAKYSVSLPTRIQVNLDWHIYRGFYVNGSAQVELNPAPKAYSPVYYNTYSLTPRWESKAFGVYLPISYVTLTKGEAGLALRLGPLFVGSGGLLSAAFGHTKELNAFVGIHIGGLRH
jgi:hypothetical protein